MEIENGAKSKHDQILSLLDEVSISGKKLGIILQTIEDSELDGRHVTVKGNKMKNFSSCSYLGLDLDQRLMAGAIDAVSRFGVQFSSSRSYLSSPLYGELEERLAKIFNAPAAVFNTTTLEFGSFILNKTATSRQSPSTMNISASCSHTRS